MFAKNSKKKTLDKNQRAFEAIFSPC